MANTIQRRQRQASPERWQRAARRAISEGIEVRQVNANGMWVANSGSQGNVAYVLEIVGGVVRSCSCPAGEFGDPCCKHAARYYVDSGRLDPEPEPPAPALAPCGYCAGQGWETVIGKSGAAFRFACQLCEGTGEVEVEEWEPAPPVPTAPAPLPCPDCAGTGSRRLRVVSPIVASGVVPIRCGRCQVTGQVVEEVAALAA